MQDGQDVAGRDEFQRPLEWLLQRDGHIQLLNQIADVGHAAFRRHHQNAIGTHVRHHLDESRGRGQAGRGRGGSLRAVGPIGPIGGGGGFDRDVAGSLGVIFFLLVEELVDHLRHLLGVRPGEGDKLGQHFCPGHIKKALKINQAPDEGCVVRNDNGVGVGHGHDGTAGAGRDVLLEHRHGVLGRNIFQQHEITHHLFALRQGGRVGVERHAFTQRRLAGAKHFHGRVVHRNKGVSVEEESGFEQGDGIGSGDLARHDYREIRSGEV